MKAFETRKASVQPQYDFAMKDIEQAMGWGWKSTHVCHGTIYPEVAEMLAKDGFNVKIVKRADDHMSYNEVSWENAEEGKEGTITYVDETQLKPQHNPDPDGILIDIIGLDDEDSDEETETDSTTQD